jgi:hypothetical protein
MATKSFTALRRIAGVVLSVLLTGAGLGMGAAAQAPAVIPAAVTTLSHSTGWGTVYQSALDMQGDWLVVDYSKGALYEFPAGGGAAIALIPAGGLGSYQNPGVAVDSQNNLYLEGNWSNCLLRFPYDPATKTWPGLATITSSAASSNCAAPYNWAQYGVLPSSWNWGFQPWGLAVDKDDNLVVANQVSGNFSFTLDVDSSGKPTNPVEIIDTMTARASSVAVDPWMNSYFVEEPDSGPLVGVLAIPAGSLHIPNDKNLTNVAPSAMQVTTGVAADLAGNLYASDKVGGIYVIPNPNGTPDTANALQVTATNGAGAVGIDSLHHIMYIPTTSYDSRGEPVEQQMRFGSAELGSAPIGTAAPNPAAVQYTFTGTSSASGMTLARATVVEDGVAVPDFAVTGGTCVMGVTSNVVYGAGGTSPASCEVDVTMTPHTVGGVSGKLLLQTAQQVPGGTAGASATFTQYSVAGSILTLTADNTFVAGEPIVINASSTDPLAALNGSSFTVLPSGLTAKQFQIQTSAIQAPATQPAKTSATATGYQFNTVATLQLHGVGIGPTIFATPSVESAFGAGLQAPAQIAADALGNIYIADPGLGKVLMYPAGSSASTTPSSVGTGLQTPTGVAVDGSGDVFIADSGSGTIYEIPFMSTGIVSGGGQVTLTTGLGTDLRLAADGLGNVYVADPAYHRVVVLSNVGQSGPGIVGQSQTFLTKGFTAPSAVAVDSNNNLYVIDGNNLFEMPNGERWLETLMTSVGGATGLAIDPSGAIYLTTSATTQRIPLVGGALVPANATTVAADLSNVTSVALDNQGNLYLTPAAGGSATVVQTNAVLTFAPFTDPAQTAALNFTVTNSGNAPLKVTGYTTTNPTVDSVGITDFTAADGTCISSSPVAAGGSCQVAVTLAPGPGEQGPISSQITLASNSVNMPVINASGVAAGLANSATAVTIGSAPEVVHAPLTVTVTSKSGGATPTGKVAVTFTSWYVANSTCPPGQTGCASVPTIYPQSTTVTSDLDSNGSAAFVLAPILAGAQTISATYIGDRIYGRSTGTSVANIAKSAIAGLKLPPNPDPTDVYLPLILGQSGSTPYDGSQVPFQYKLQVTVDTAAGVPVGTLKFMDNSSTCPTGTSATGQGAATCALANYSGVACPYSAGDGVLNIQNSGTPTGAQASFNAPCLYNVPANATYTPVIFTHSITPVYSGDANFLPYTGQTPTLIQITRSPMVQITSSDPASATTPPAVTVKAGSSANLDLTITSVLGYGIAGRGGSLNDYNYPVSLACTNLPPHTVCSFAYPNPDPLIPTAVDIPCPSTATTTQIAAGQASCTPGHATVTFYSNVTAGTTTSQNARTTSVTLAAIFGFGIFGLFFRRKSFEKARLLLMVVLMIVGVTLAGSITACSTSTLAPAAGLSTPSGSYAVTISAQQVGQQCIPQTGANTNCTTSSGQTGKWYYGSQNQVSLPFVVNLTVQ